MAYVANDRWCSGWRDARVAVARTIGRWLAALPRADLAGLERLNAELVAAAIQRAGTQAPHDRCRRLGGYLTGLERWLGRSGASIRIDVRAELLPITAYDGSERADVAGAQSPGNVLVTTARRR